MTIFCCTWRLQGGNLLALFRTMNTYLFISKTAYDGGREGIDKTWNQVESQAGTKRDHPLSKKVQSPGQKPGVEEINQTQSRSWQIASLGLLNPMSGHSDSLLGQSFQKGSQIGVLWRDSPGTEHGSRSQETLDPHCHPIANTGEEVPSFPSVGEATSLLRAEVIFSLTFSIFFLS